MQRPFVITLPLIAVLLLGQADPSAEPVEPTATDLSGTVDPFADAPASGDATPAPKPPPFMATVPDPEPWPELLEAWYTELGATLPSERFGELLLRASKLQLDRPYLLPPQTDEDELLRVDLNGFECVTLVESAMAVARCTWQETPDQACFEAELRNLRYRDGEIDGYGSRLHYFSEWLDEQVEQGRAAPMTEALGGEAVPFTFDYMSKRAHRYPALADPAVHERIVQVERQLSASPRPMIPQESIQPIHGELVDGDIVAIVGTRPGLFIRHVGLVEKGDDGLPRLLHASSHLRRVTVTKGSIGNYINWNDNRVGIVVLRPTAPGDRDEPIACAPGVVGCTCDGADCFPAFEATVEPLSAELRDEMTGLSWREGCPVHLDDLRHIQLTHWDFYGNLRRGELIVAAHAADAMVRIFERVYDARWPIERMERVDRYGASDDRSMDANNTSAFNCRTVAGTSRWSQHAYGTAIDINPIQNPWVRGSQVDPPLGVHWVHREGDKPGMLIEGDPVVRAFDAEGWGWGGRWTKSKDYQHFSESGR